MTAKFSIITLGLFLATQMFRTAQAQAPVAAFSADQVSGCAPLVVHFTDESTGTPTGWDWNLGNGTMPHDQQNVSTTYFDPGQYTVTLTARNANGSNTVTKTKYITVYAKPTIAFSSNITAGCPPLTVAFTDKSTPGDGTLTNWSWGFGDGFASPDQNPTHTYTLSGSFPVTLKATNSFGCTNSASVANDITVYPKPGADFSNTGPSSCSPPATVNFQNLTTGMGSMSYVWDFGDGTTSTAATPPAHTYTARGNYTVKLIAKNSNGCTDTIIKPDLISLNMQTSFSAPDTACSGVPFTLTNTSDPAGASSWSFGDLTASSDTNATHTYASTGTYTVTLTNVVSGCSGFISKKIVVVDPPVADFASDKAISCKTPFAVQFTDQSTGATSYQWDFGDGGTSTNANPSHTYTATGKYAVTLTITDRHGCTSTVSKTDFIQVAPAEVDIPSVPDSNCAPFKKFFTATVTSIDPVTQYIWSFGDGTSFSDPSSPSTTHTYAGLGTYGVYFVVQTASGCSDTTFFNPGITVSPKPEAGFKADTLFSCARDAIAFTDTSKGDDIDQWLWSFGDGGGSAAQNPTYVYKDTGYFSVQLIVYDHGCADTIRHDHYLYIRAPIGKFTVATSCANPLTVSITDKSIAAQHWLWDFGDGTTLTENNSTSPNHTYADTGTYTIRLKVVNDTSGCDYTTQASVLLVALNPVFAASDTLICKNDSITFTAHTNNPAQVKYYNWNFGDGSFIQTTDSVITHTYTSSNNYTVSLSVTDILNCNEPAPNLRVRVTSPKALFTPSVTGTCRDSAVTFTDHSTSGGINPLEQWIWNLGDGTIDTLTATSSLTHTYSNPGSYAVTLKITDTLGCVDTYTSTFTVAQPHAAFQSADTLVCTNHQATFKSSSSGSNLTYVWILGDGDTLRGMASQVMHVYTKDTTYNIKLLITDQYGCKDSTARPNYIHSVTPVANFGMSDSTSTCPPLQVFFTDSSKYALAWNWNFGDGSPSNVANPNFYYNYPGTYTITETITGPSGCTSSKSRQVHINGPTGIILYDPITQCIPVTVNFSSVAQNTVSYTWDYSDGTTDVTTVPSSSHTYTYPGSYIPRMILTDAAGCNVAIRGTNVIKANGIIAGFTTSSHFFCDSGIAHFTDQSYSNESITYQWYFGDGTTSTARNPSHTFNAGGLDTVKLVATSFSGCVDSALDSIPVKIIPSPKVALHTSPDSCIPLHELFTGEILVPDTSALSWSWNFGNGNVSNEQNPPLQTYPVAKAYTVSLIVTNSSGCSTQGLDTVVNAYPIPVIHTINDTYVCLGNSIPLPASGGSTYSWSPATFLSCTNCDRPVSTPDSLITYQVVGTSEHGCTDTTNVTISVQYPFVMHYGAPDTLCLGESSDRLTASGADKYSWSPVAGLNNPSVASPVATPDATVTYRVIGSDNKGCFSDTGYVQIIVNSLPSVNAGPDATINVGRSYIINPTVSADTRKVVWTPSGDISSNAYYPGIDVKPNQTTSYQVEVTNMAGCTAKDDITIYVVCNNANIYMPNTFSPDGNGHNDWFYPRGTGLFRIQSLRIYNRWGQEVFQNANFAPNEEQSGWNGTFNGVKVDPDVYVYVMEVVCDNNSVITYKGNIAVVR